MEVPRALPVGLHKKSFKKGYTDDFGLKFFTI